MVLSDADRRELSDFPLAWRWTRKTDSAFPSEDLELLMPLTKRASARVHEEALRIHTRGGLSRGQVTEWCSCETRDRPPYEVASWLLALPPHTAELVVASWDASTALCLPWGLFARRWVDFCYPSSDNVTVLPQEGLWVLAYDHEERLEWAVHRSG